MRLRAAKGIKGAKFGAGVEGIGEELGEKQKSQITSITDSEARRLATDTAPPCPAIRRDG